MDGLEKKKTKGATHKRRTHSDKKDLTVLLSSIVRERWGKGEKRSLITGRDNLNVWRKGKSKEHDFLAVVRLSSAPLCTIAGLVPQYASCMGVGEWDPEV